MGVDVPSFPSATLSPITTLASSPKKLSHSSVRSGLSDTWKKRVMNWKIEAAGMGEMPRSLGQVGS